MTVSTLVSIYDAWPADRQSQSMLWTHFVSSQQLSPWWVASITSTILIFLIALIIIYIGDTPTISTMQVRHLNETLLKNEHLPHPGIGPILPQDEVTHHAYYQWVPFVLFAQAICFYLPHLIWRSWEGGKIKSLVIGLQLVLLSKHLNAEEDMKVRNDLIISSKPTLDKKVRYFWKVFMSNM